MLSKMTKTITFEILGKSSQSISNVMFLGDLAGLNNLLCVLCFHFYSFSLLFYICDAYASFALGALTNTQNFKISNVILGISLSSFLLIIKNTIPILFFNLPN